MDRAIQPAEMRTALEPAALRFSDPMLLERLEALDDAALDALPFGVIGFGLDVECRVLRYNATEARGAGLQVVRVLGLQLFTVVAQCMNNYLIAQRFDDALAQGTRLDETLNWVFTLCMRPTPVVLRLMAAPGLNMRFVAVLRQA
jgi:photoactive yellow protein